MYAFMNSVDGCTIPCEPSKDYVIFPMNIAESHWAMGAIDLKDKGFRYFDSMFSRSEERRLKRLLG